jgi:Peptidase family M48
MNRIFLNCARSLQRKLTTNATPPHLYGVPASYRALALTALLVCMAATACGEADTSQAEEDLQASDLAAGFTDAELTEIGLIDWDNKEAFFAQASQEGSPQGEGVTTEDAIRVASLAVLGNGGEVFGPACPLPTQTPISRAIRELLIDAGASPRTLERIEFSSENDKWTASFRCNNDRGNCPVPEIHIGTAVTNTVVDDAELAAILAHEVGHLQNSFDAAERSKTGLACGTQTKSYRFRERYCPEFAKCRSDDAACQKTAESLCAPKLAKAFRTEERKADQRIAITFSGNRTHASLDPYLVVDWFRDRYPSPKKSDPALCGLLCDHPQQEWRARMIDNDLRAAKIPKQGYRRTRSLDAINAIIAAQH